MKAKLVKPALMAGFGILALATSAASLNEGFSSDPLERGWKVIGDAQLFRWDTNTSTLEVTWDSSRRNSFYAVPLGQTLGRSSDFSIAFDLELAHFAAGVSPQAPNPFQISVALVNLARASGTNFFRGTGSDSPDLVDFSFFPDPGGAWQWGASLSAALIDSTGTNWSTGGFAPLGLDSNTVYRVSVQYTASNQTLRAVVMRGTEEFAVLSAAKPGTGFTDFAVDHFAVCSYSEAGQFPAYAGSILARGWIDNVVINTPERFAIKSFVFQEGRPEVRFESRAGWKYTLQGTTNLSTWHGISEAVIGTGSEMSLRDTNAPAERAFYRVKAEPGQ